MVYDVEKIGYEGGQYQGVMLGGKCLAITKDGEGEKYCTISIESEKNYSDARFYISGYGDKKYDISSGSNEFCIPIPQERTDASFMYYSAQTISFYSNYFNVVDFSNVNVEGTLCLYFRVKKRVILPKTIPAALSLDIITPSDYSETIDITPYVCCYITTSDNTPYRIGRIGGREDCVFTALRTIVEVGSIDADVRYIYLRYMDSDSIRKIIQAAGEQNRDKLHISIQMRDGEEIADDIYTLAEEKGIDLRQA